MFNNKILVSNNNKTFKDQVKKFRNIFQYQINHKNILRIEFKKYKNLTKRFIKQGLYLS